MAILIVIAAIVILAAVVFLAQGRGGGLSVERGDYAPLDLGPVSATDVALLRPPANAWGYNMQATDEALGQIAASIRERDIRIVALEQLVTDLSREPQLSAQAAPLARHRAPGTGPIPQAGAVSQAGVIPQAEAAPPARAVSWTEEPSSWFADPLPPAPWAKAKEPAAGPAQTSVEPISAEPASAGPISAESISAEAAGAESAGAKSAEAAAETQVPRRERSHE